LYEFIKPFLMVLSNFLKLFWRKWSITFLVYDIIQTKSLKKTASLFGDTTDAYPLWRGGNVLSAKGLSLFPCINECRPSMLTPVFPSGQGIVPSIGLKSDPGKVLFEQCRNFPHERVVVHSGACYPTAFVHLPPVALQHKIIYFANCLSSA
jgi:hypothetical protein